MQASNESGRRLESAIRAAMLAHAPRLTIVGLAKSAGVQRDTLYDWFTGKSAPETSTLTAVAQVLDVQMSSLLDAYQGRQPDITVLGPDGRVVAAAEVKGQTVTLTMDDLRRITEEAAELAVRKVLAEVEEVRRAEADRAAAAPGEPPAPSRPQAHP